MNAVTCGGLDDAAPEVLALTPGKLVTREKIEGSHGGRTMDATPVGRNRKVGDKGA